MTDHEMPSEVVPAWLLKETFAVQYNPNCPSPWLVRLVGFNAGGLDLKSYYGETNRTKDALGFGKTLEEAALKAKAIVEAARQEFLRGLPVYGGTAGRLADVAAAAGRDAYESHVSGGRLEPDSGRATCHA